MATYQLNESYPPYEYGSAVQWRRAGAPLLRGCICGFNVVESSERAIALGVQAGTVVALIEESSGGTVEVPLSQLELI